MTKRYTLSLLFIALFSFTALRAQLTEGTRFLGTASGGASSIFYRTPLGVYGGVAELSGIFGEGTNFLGIQVAPDLGYFVSDHVMVGGVLLVNTLTNFDNTFSTVGAIPKVRYYINPEAANTYFYGQAQAGFLFSLNDSDFNTFPFSIGAGLTHMLAPGVGLDGFMEIRDADLSSDGSTSLAIGATLNIFLNQSMYNARTGGTANLQRGTLMIGGTGGALNFGLSDVSSTGVSLEPQIFYFLNPQLAVGGGVLLDFSNVNFSFANITSTNLGISPQLRYYFSQAEHRLWFIGGGIDISYRRVEADNFPDETSTETSTNFAVGAGLNSFITPNVAFELGPSLRIDPSNSQVRLGIDLGVQVFLKAGE